MFFLLGIKLFSLDNNKGIGGNRGEMRLLLFKPNNKNLKTWFKMETFLTLLQVLIMKFFSLITIPKLLEAIPPQIEELNVKVEIIGDLCQDESNLNIKMEGFPVLPLMQVGSQTIIISNKFSK